MADKKQAVSAGIRSVFSAQGTGKPGRKAEESFAEREQAARDEVAERRAPSFSRGRPRKDEQRDWDKSREFHTSICMNRDQYVEMTDIAYEARLSLKITMNKLLAAGIKAYRKNPNILGQ